MAGKDVRERTTSYIREDVKSTTARPYPMVCYFLLEQENMVYAAKRVPQAIRAKYPDLAAVRDGLCFWGQGLAADFLRRLCAEWSTEMVLGFRTSVEEKHGYAPRLLLGDISQRGGGLIKLPGGGIAHYTHQHGSQIDIYYLTCTGDNKTVVFKDGKSDKENNWNLDLNTRLLRAIFKAGAKSVLTECEPFFRMDEFTALVSAGRITSKPPHRDHFHIELG